MAKTLTPLQVRFLDAYRVSRNATEAYKLAYTPKTKNERTIFRNAFAVLNNPKIQATLKAEGDARAEKLNVTPDMVAKRLWEIATANPNEIMQHRRACCRHCHGVDGKYQWTEQQFFEQVARAKRAAKPGTAPLLPDGSGGFGFKETRRPNPDCTECAGEGVDRVYIADTRDLKGGAALLYAGVKTTKDGIEIKFHDQAKAIDQFTKLVGFDVTKFELTGKDGAPLMPASEMSDEQLAAIVAAAAGNAAP